MTFRDEDGHAWQFKWRTIQTWWYWYRQNGLVEPPQRADKGTTRKVCPEELLEAIEKVMPTFRESPGNIQAIYRACIEQGHLRREQVAPNTFRRNVKKFELLKSIDAMVDGPAKKARLAFAKAHANDMWQADTLHGPYINVGGKSMKTYLICFIDDASRVISHGQFYLADSTVNLMNCFNTAIFKRGVPKSLYFDNGSNYSSKEFTLICARLGIQLIHTPVRDGAAKGKIERFFRTTRDQYLIRNLKDTSLDQLNTGFIDWVENTYHQRVHSTLGMSPLDRFGLDLHLQRFLTPSPFNKEIFYVEENRTVRSDNTFNLNGVRYQAPVDLRNLKIQVRFDRADKTILPIVYSNAERMGEAVNLDFTGNDRGPKFKNQP